MSEIFSNVCKFKMVVKKRRKTTKITQNRPKLTEIASELHRKVIKKFKTRRIVTYGIDEIWAIDLLIMTQYSKENWHYKCQFCHSDCGIISLQLYELVKFALTTMSERNVRVHLVYAKSDDPSGKASRVLIEYLMVYMTDGTKGEYAFDPADRPLTKHPEIAALKPIQRGVAGLKARGAQRFALCIFLKELAKKYLDEEGNPMFNEALLEEISDPDSATIYFSYNVKSFKPTCHPATENASYII